MTNFNLLYKNKTKKFLCSIFLFFNLELNARNNNLKIGPRVLRYLNIYISGVQIGASIEYKYKKRINFSTSIGYENLFGAGRCCIGIYNKLGLGVFTTKSRKGELEINIIPLIVLYKYEQISCSKTPKFDYNNLNENSYKLIKAPKIPYVDFFRFYFGFSYNFDLGLKLGLGIFTCRPNFPYDTYIKSDKNHEYPYYKFLSFILQYNVFKFLNIFNEKL